MKTAYKILLSAIGIAALSWCLPWLYSMLLPESVNDPFVAFSPVSDSFVVSDNDHIFSVDNNGNVICDNITKEQRDSLIPQTYFNQLMARGEMPDHIADDSISIPLLKQNQWTFSSIPHDVNSRKAKVYPIMESMPVRFELEDATEVFVIRNDKIQFIDMATNKVNESRSEKFQRVLNDRGVKFPIKDIDADITTRKPYDEGYLFIDASGSVFHMKMQGGQPYLSKVDIPGDVLPRHVYILENPEPRHLGLIHTADNHLYVIERDGHRAIRLPVDNIDPTIHRISIYKNLFNWIIKLRSDSDVRWIAVNSSDYALLGQYSIKDKVSVVECISSYIFPFDLSFTDVSDSFAHPRIANISWHAIYLNLLLTIIVAILSRRRRDSVTANSIATLIFGIYYFIVYLIIK